MKYIITGANGTLAPYVIAAIKENGHEVVIYDRKKVSTEVQWEIDNFIDQEKPDVFLHLATGPVEWIEFIIRSIKRYKIPLVFTSTESVFSEEQLGPYNEQTEPKSESDYGRYKRGCEKLILELYGEYSYIVRIGWQIGLTPEKNNMLAYLVEEKEVKASVNWLPSTSFMPDTAIGLINIVKRCKPGVYHMDGNLEGWNYYQIVTALKEIFDLPISIIRTEDYVRNNRLISDQQYVTSIQERIRNYEAK